MLLLFPRRGKHSRDAIDFLIAKPPAKLIDNDIRNSINAFTFPP